MAAYVETLQLMENTVAPESSDADVFEAYAEGASRLFDLLCDVEENFFAPADVLASEKTFFGDGINMLRLPPFVADSITGITVDDAALDAADYKIRNGFLMLKDGDAVFAEDEEITVTARWGFAEVPADVRIVVQELANYLWRNKDPLFAKISDVEVEKELSPTVNAAIKKFRDKYGQSAY